MTSDTTGTTSTTAVNDLTLAPQQGFTRNPPRGICLVVRLANESEVTINPWPGRPMT